MTNLLCVNIGDDMFDFTGGYTGTVTNAFGVREAGFNNASEDSRGIEGDSNSSDVTATPVSKPTFEKVTVLNLNLRRAPFRNNSHSYNRQNKLGHLNGSLQATLNLTF